MPLSLADLAFLPEKGKTKEKKECIMSGRMLKQNGYISFRQCSDRAFKRKRFIICFFFSVHAFCQVSTDCLGALQRKHIGRLHSTHRLTVYSKTCLSRKWNPINYNGAIDYARSSEKFSTLQLWYGGPNTFVSSFCRGKKNS